MKEVILALDQGSSSSRAILFDLKGGVAAQAAVPVKTSYPKAGWIEHDALDLAASQEKALDLVLRKAPRGSEIAAMGLATQRSTIVFWDGETGEPLAPALSWQDGRAASVVAPLQDRQAWAHERTGLYLTPYYSGPKIRWALENVDAVKKAAASGRLRLGPVGSFLLWRLTKGAVFIADPTLAQRMMLFNLRTGAWDDELIALFGAPKDALPTVTSSSGRLAVVERGKRSLPVTALLGDQQAAAAALGGGASGAGVLNYGTGAFFLLHTGASQHRVPGLLTSVAWRRGAKPTEYFEEGTVHAAATSFHWLKDNLGLLDSVEKLDEAVSTSTHRLLALPAIGGLGAPRWDYRTFTSLVGLTSQTRPADVVRAVAEGLTFLLADIVVSCRAAGLKTKSVAASGGLSRSDTLLQFQADLLQQPVARLHEAESTAMCAAMLAAEGAGLRWEGPVAAARVERKFEPRIDGEEAKRLLEAWRVFVDAQQALSARLRELKVLG